MDDETYTVKEASAVLKVSPNTVYRRVREGDIPYKAGRPMRLPKRAIDTIAKIKAKPAESKKLTFKFSTVAELWDNIERAKEVNKNEDDISFEAILPWIYANKKISKCVTRGKTVLGWTVFLPLPEQMILEVMKGQRKREDIPAKAVKKWEDVNISVYIPIFEVFPTNDTVVDKRVAVFLIKEAIKWALTLSDKHHVKNWYVIINTAKGQKLVQELGFKQINTLDDEEKECYQLNTDDPRSGLLAKFSKKRKRR